MTDATTTYPKPNAVYHFEGATVRIYGTCTNIKGETEKFLKQVLQRTSRKKERKGAAE